MPLKERRRIGSAMSFEFAEGVAMKTRLVLMAAALILTGGMSRIALAQSAQVRQVTGPIWIAVPTTAGVMQSIQAKVPANGNLLVTVTGTMTYDHVLGAQGYYCLQLSQTSAFVGGCVPDAGSDSAVRSSIVASEPSTVSGFGASSPYSIVKVIPVTAGMTYTFYLNGFQTGLNTSWLFQPTITALYVPGTLQP